MVTGLSGNQLRWLDGLLHQPSPPPSRAASQGDPAPAAAAVLFSQVQLSSLPLHSQGALPPGSLLSPLGGLSCCFPSSPHSFKVFCPHQGTGRGSHLPSPKMLHAVGLQGTHLSHTWSPPLAHHPHPDTPWTPVPGLTQILRPVLEHTCKDIHLPPGTLNILLIRPATHSYTLASTREGHASERPQTAP